MADDPTRLPGTCRTPHCAFAANAGHYCSRCAVARFRARKAGRPPGPPPGPRHGEWWVDIARLTAIVDTGPDALTATRWREHARCATAPTDMFYADQNNRPAKQVCATCPALYACLAYGLDQDHGVWGGTTRGERVRVRRAVQTHRRARATRAEGAA
jgi:WhiB family transcriptional regulator, redox-sensing transcriptional regulator